jgi:transcriptional regulator with XRE-family HTH domain
MPYSKSKAQRTQFFSATFALLLERNNVSQVELAAATGIAVSRINNYLHGKYRTIRPDHLASLARAAGKTSEERSELIRSYLLDLLPESLHGVVRIESVAGKAKSARPPVEERNVLPQVTKSALVEIQRLGARSAKARERTEWFAELLREAHQG